MKIFVRSKLEMNKQFFKDSNWFNEQDRWFISITNYDDTFAYPFTGKRFLKLKFDDLIDTDLRFEPNGVLFDEDDANKIKEFIDKIPEDVKQNGELYVNCNGYIFYRKIYFLTVSDHRLLTRFFKNFFRIPEETFIV